MNFHVIFVHFPIALFTIYALLELVSIKKLNELSYWFYVKAVLVITGAASALITLQTGDAVEDQYHNFRALVEIHSTWAGIATAIFAVMAVVYAVVWINRQWHLDQRVQGSLSKAWNLLTKLSVFILKRWVLVILALLGLIAITFTGALGGAIAKGPDIDPIVYFIYHLYFVK